MNRFNTYHRCFKSVLLAWGLSGSGWLWAQVPASPPGPAGAELAEKLRETVANISGKEERTAADYARMAGQTIQYGEVDVQVKKSILTDGLEAVEAGEALAPAAERWQEMRQKLQELLKREPPKGQGGDEKNQNKNNPPQNSQKKDPSQNPQNTSDPSQEEKSKNKPPQQDQQSQKGQQDSKKEEEQQNAESQQPKPSKTEEDEQQKNLKSGQNDAEDSKSHEKKKAMPVPLQEVLNRLNQVKSQDAPAVLFQRMHPSDKAQRRQLEPNGKNW